MKRTSMHLVGVVRDEGRILVPPIAVLLLHILRQVVLPARADLDMSAHLLGGFAMAWSGAILYRTLRARKTVGPLPLPFYGFVLLGGVAGIGILWELMEWTIFHTIVTLPPGIDVWSDTVSDLALDLLGGTLWIAADAFRRKT